MPQAPLDVSDLFWFSELKSVLNILGAGWAIPSFTQAGLGLLSGSPARINWAK